MLGRSPSANSGRRFAGVGFHLIMFAFFLAVAVVDRAFAATEAGGDASSLGLSAVVVPTETRPGDVFELRIEMSRQSWGRFEVGKLEHPQLRMIAKEKIPVSYRSGQYKQRHSLFLQSISSGVVEIGATEVDILTSDGKKTVELPALSLNVVPFDSPALSDSPLSLPADDKTEESGSMFSILFWIGVALSVLGIWSIIFFGMRSQNSQTPSFQVPREVAQIQKILGCLHAGDVPKDDLESLLQSPTLCVSAQLRSKIEQAVYSPQVEPMELADSLLKELQT